MGSKANQPLTPAAKLSRNGSRGVRRCDLCPGLMARYTIGRYHVCGTCYKRFQRYQCDDHATLERRAHQVIADLVCMIWACRGYETAEFYAVKLVQAIDPAFGHDGKG